jgi:TonB family protein
MPPTAPSGLETHCFLALAFLALAASPASAIAAPKLEDAYAWIMQAKQVNALTGSDIPAWRLKATFRLYDDQQNVQGQGSFEELWVNSSKWMRTYKSDSFTRTEYGTAAGILQTGSADSSPWQLARLHQLLADPLPSEEIADKQDFTATTAKILGTKLFCIDATAKPQGLNANIIPDAEYCLDEHDKMLRRQTLFSDNLLILRTGQIQFEGRRLPADMIVSHIGKLGLSIHLDSIEPLADPNDPKLQPPAEAKLQTTVNFAGDPAALDKRVELDAKATEGLLIRQIPPVYPPIAKAAHIQGVVILQAKLGKKGEVQELSVESGPPMLQQAALDAVHQWIYKPYTVNGKPVEIYTKVHVIFQLTGKPGK